MPQLDRRDFLALTTAVPTIAWAQSSSVNIFDLSDGAPSIAHAIEQLRLALGQQTNVHKSLGEIHQAAQRVVIARATSREARQIAGTTVLPATPESLALLPGRLDNEPVLLISGGDSRGIVYGILELADRVRHGASPGGISAAVEQPVNAVRSIARLFVSELEDKPWFYNQVFWRDYLSMLIAQRFNRFSLTLGLGYDLPRRVVDSYFLFAYPYLVSLPGYNVKVTGLNGDEPARNLAMLKWISNEAAARGLHFQLALWSHTYQLIDSPRANHTVEGLTPANHAAYCRDALAALLDACPSIQGITFRAHSESGIADGSYDFWKTVFSAVKDCGRRVEIDLHSKGITAVQIRMAIDTGQPVKVSPKLTAEHMGLPAHQAAIREQERTQASSTPQERSFTRYGYADYLPEDREYSVYFRIWPGTQKLLLWGDPAMAAGYGRHAGFCGALGMELCEPLSFKSRHGSGHSPERPIYADKSLEPQGGDWHKYLYTYRLWGRRLYDPDAKPEDYRRYLRKEYGTMAAAPIEAALGLASRIHPLVTSAHLPSASNLSNWQEIYSNLPIMSGIPHPFGELRPPRVFSRVSPLDPALFCSVHEFATAVTSGRMEARYTPVDVALWLEGMAQESERQLSAARARSANAGDPSFRRLAIDVTACNCFGRFFAHKIRAAIAFSMHETNGEVSSLRIAVAEYRLAREAWARLIQTTRGAYMDDISFGEAPHLRGHWADRLPAIEQDLKAMEAILAAKDTDPAVTLPPPPAWLKPRPAAPALSHRSPASFRPGEPLSLELTCSAKTVSIHCRHVNQAELYQVEPMIAAGNRWRFTIPGQFTDSAFPIMYFFEMRGAAGHAWLYPGLNADLSNQPYYAIRRA